MRRRVLVIVIAVGVLFGAPAISAPTHDHHHEGHGQLEFNHGVRWATDAPLRQAMNRIRDAIQERVDAIHANELSPDGYAALATDIENGINEMIMNCRLPPAADAELHKLIAMLSESVQKMRQGPEHRAGAVQAVKALTLYGKYFDHEGWQPLVH